MIKISHLTYLYSQKSTDGISDLSIDIKTGEILCLLGPSGSGKTTTLKCIAGLISDYKGSIDFTQKHHISYVDQSINLNENEDVFTNLKSKIKVDLSDEQAESQIRSILSRLELTNEIHSKVNELSGGQKQRVVMAQSLVNNPTLLLLDEPFANLDPVLKQELITDMLSIFSQENITVIWVTHNTQEALRYSDRLAIINFGKLYQVGTPHEVYHRPNSLFTAKYFGDCNALVCKVKTTGPENTQLNYNNETISINHKDASLKENQHVLLFIKPEAIELTQTGMYKAKVQNKEFLGSENLIQLNWKNHIIYCKCPSTIEVPNEVQFNLKTDYLHYLNEV